MTERPAGYDVQPDEPLILMIRDQRVILDFTLAAIYGVATKVLNQAVKRNIGRFPEDFKFRLTWPEARHAKSQSAILDAGSVSRSQIVTLKQGLNVKYPPFAFTEHGAVMAANLLRSERAIQMNVFVVRTFVRMRRMLSGQSDLAARLARVESLLTAHLDSHESATVEVLKRIMRLLSPPSEPEPDLPPPRKIGFHVREPFVGPYVAKGPRARGKRRGRTPKCER